MLRRPAAACVAALSFAALIGAATPASAAPAPSTAVQHLRSNLFTHGLLKPGHTRAAVTAAATGTMPVYVIGQTDPLQTLEGTTLSVTFVVADENLDPATAVTPTGTVDIYDAARPYMAKPVLGAAPLATVDLVSDPSTPGVATATYTASAGLPATHDFAAVYSGDATFAAGDPTASDFSAFAGAEVVEGGPLAGDRRLLQRLYFDLLGRRYDGAGLDYWLSVVKARPAGQGQADAAYAMARSPEVYEKEIRAVYQALLGRVVDQGGLAYWLDLFSNGATVQALEIEIAGTSEFAKQFPDNPSLVSSTYELLLGRPADADGLTYYSDLLDSKKITPQDLVFDLAFSDEALGHSVDALYFSVLQRTADSEGKAYWVKSIRAGYREELVAYSMTQSPEYQNFLK